MEEEGGSKSFLTLLNNNRRWSSEKACCILPFFMEGEKICTFVSMFALSLFLNWRNCLFPSSCEDEYGYESNNGIREALHPELRQDSKDELFQWHKNLVVKFKIKKSGKSNSFRIVRLYFRRAKPNFSF